MGEDADSTIKNDIAALEISRMKWEQYVAENNVNVEADEFQSLTEIAQWVDTNESSVDMKGNCEIVYGNIGVRLIVSPVNGIREGLFFKYPIWGNGQWVEVKNSYDILMFHHVFSEVVSSIVKN